MLHENEQAYSRAFFGRFKNDNANALHSQNQTLSLNCLIQIIVLFYDVASSCTTIVLACSHCALSYGKVVFICRLTFTVIFYV